MPLYVDPGKGHLARFGVAPIRGEMSQTVDVTLGLPKKPKSVIADARFEVLARE